MTFNEEFARRFAEQLRTEDPDAQYKRPSYLSRRDLVVASYEAIRAKREAGYSFAGIAAQFEKLGAPIRVSTLKSYLQQHASKTRSGRPTTSPKIHSSKGSPHTAASSSSGSQKKRTASRRPPGETATPNALPGAGASSGAEAATNLTVEARADSSAAAVAASASERRKTRETSSARAVNPLAATVEPGGREETSNVAPSTQTDSTEIFPMSREPASGAARAGAPSSPAPTVLPSSFPVATRMAPTGSGEKKLPVAGSSSVRPDAPIPAPSRPDALSRLFQDRTSSPERGKNAFIPRRDQEL